MVGRGNGHSWVAGGIDMGTMGVRSCSHSDACVAGAVGSTKDPDVGKAIVGQGACCSVNLTINSSPSLRAAQPNSSICEISRDEDEGLGRRDDNQRQICEQTTRTRTFNNFFFLIFGRSPLTYKLSRPCVVG